MIARLDYDAREDRMVEALDDLGSLIGSQFSDQLFSVCVLEATVSCMHQDSGYTRALIAGKAHLAAAKLHDELLAHDGQSAVRDEEEQV